MDNEMQDYEDILAEILIDEQTLQARVKELGSQISMDYMDTDGNLLLICILRGGVPFLVDLSRYITTPHMVDVGDLKKYNPSSGYEKKKKSRYCQRAYPCLSVRRTLGRSCTREDH